MLIRTDTPGTVICVVSYNGHEDLERCLNSCAAHADGTPVYVVDNASSDRSADMVSSKFPDVRLFTSAVNLGFAGGCNIAIRAALEAGADSVLLLNPDVELSDATLSGLRALLAATPDAAAVQPAIMRPDGLVNSLGNVFHYLGFSMAGGNGLTVAEAERELPWLRAGWRSGVAVPACSGAAVLIRAAALRDVGLLEEEFFLYHEDLELSLRLRRAGWSLWLLGDVEVVHRYEFSRNAGKWYYLERNRHWLLAAHLRKRTLGLLAVPLIGAEVLVWLQAAGNGWAGEKLRSYEYWIQPGRFQYLRLRRRALGAVRRCDDRDVLREASTRLTAAEARNRFSDRVVDPVSAFVWSVVRPLMRW